MYISKIEIKNFRILLDTNLDLRRDTSLLIGRNNCGKTSFLVLFENFYHARSFDYNDFPVKFRERLVALENLGDANDLRIQMRIEITYDENDNLKTLSEFILDLDPEKRTVKILFECAIEEKSLLKEIEGIAVGSEERKKFIIKNIHKYMKRSVYAYADDSDLLEENRKNLIEKNVESVRKLINLQVVHAKRDIASSEGSQHKRVLSALATNYFNKQNNVGSAFAEINAKMAEMDGDLDLTYGTFFEPFLRLRTH
jgi:predicted ATP-dependent endonuclease of OLD family